MIGYRLVLALLALLMLLLNGAVADRRSAPAKDLLPGDPAPELKIGKWLHKGVYDWVQPVGRDERRITVVEFWADWCPLSRAVLPVHDRLQARLRNQGIRFVAIGEGHLDSIQAIVKQLALRNIAVAYDDGGAVFNAYLGGRSEIPMPFAAVIEESSKLDRSRVLWQGPAITYEGARAWDEGYTSRLQDILDKVAAGRYDVASAREIELARADARRLSDRVRSAGQAGKLSQLRTLVKEIMARKPQAECNDPLVGALATASWFLMESKEPGSERASDALNWIQAAIKLNGKEHPDLLHVYARALFECGKVEAAVAAEQRVMELPRKNNSGFDYAEALARYKAALPGNGGKKVDGQKSQSEAVKAPEPRKEEKPPADRLTSEQAASDLLALHNHLRLNYAAYDDIAWRFAGEGASWQKHNAAFIDRVKARSDWPLCDFFDLVTEYLKVVHDRHLWIEGTLQRGDARRHEQSRPTTGFSPFFADVRVRESNGQMTLVKAPEGASIPSGAVLADVPVIAGPFTARAGHVYLFPTLPLESTGSKEYLLGLLAEPSSSPGPVKVKIVAPSSGGAAGQQDMELPVHRGRQTYEPWDRNAAPWSLELKPIPLLKVRRLWGDGMDGLPETADALRDQPVAVLDFRTNGGGSDMWAMQWVQRFSKQAYTAYNGAAELRRGETDPLRRWDSRAGIRTGDPEDSSAPASGQRYQGRLLVITGTHCGSSGETFTNLASQVPGAVLVGENTAGFVTYGNIDQSFVCPHAGITVHFGRTRFAMGKRPVYEQIGMFPDYWLDEPDPVPAIAAYCSLK